MSHSRNCGGVVCSGVGNIIFTVIARFNVKKKYCLNLNLNPECPVCHIDLYNNIISSKNTIITQNIRKKGYRFCVCVSHL